MGALSDRVGRKPLLIIFSALTLFTAYPVMAWLVGHISFPNMLIALLWLSFLYGSYNGAMVVALTEIVPAAVRTAGFSLAYSLATAIFGGFTPSISTWLIEQTGDRAAPGIWLSVGGLCGLIATLDHLSHPHQHPRGPRMKLRIAIAALLATTAIQAVSVQAAEIRVVSSGGFAAAFKVLAPEWERQTGNTIVAEWGPSMGTTQGAIPERLARGEKIDVVIMVGYALDKLVEQGKVAAADTAPLARSGIGIVVKQGAPQPDISTPDALKRALLAATSIAYSDSASGVYIQNEMFKKLGIEDQVKGKARMIPAEPVGAVVARGDAQIGFQQISELKPITGITLVGPVPAPLQQYTVFSAGVLTASTEKEAALSLIHFFGTPGAATAIANSGMEPTGTPK